MIKDKSLSLISFKCFIFFSNLLFILSSIVPEQNNIFCVAGVFPDALCILPNACISCVDE